MLNFISDDVRRDPFAMYASVREAQPVLQVPGADMWMVLGYDAVKRALTDQEAFSSNAAPARGINFEWLLFMDPPRHTQLRALILKAFTPRSVARSFRARTNPVTIVWCC